MGLTGAALVGLEQHAALVQVQLAQDGRRLAAHRHELVIAGFREIIAGTSRTNLRQPLVPLALGRAAKLEAAEAAAAGGDFAGVPT